MPRWLLVLGALAVVAAVIFGGRAMIDYFRQQEAASPGSSTTSATPARRLAPVEAVSVLKPSSESAYGGPVRRARYLVDGDIETFWSTKDDDAAPRVRLEFSRPVTVVRVEIVNGAPGKAFSERRRPKNIELQFSGGRPQQVGLTKAGPAIPQFVEIRAPVVGQWVDLTVLDFYPGKADGTNNHLRTAISEIRFFTES
jgi:hypothetical protein